MAKSFAARFRIEPGKRAHLNRRDPGDLKAFPDRKTAEEQSVKDGEAIDSLQDRLYACLLYTSPSPRDPKTSRMPSSA